MFGYLKDLARYVGLTDSVRYLFKTIPAVDFISNTMDLVHSEEMQNYRLEKNMKNYYKTREVISALRGPSSFSAFVFSFLFLNNPYYYLAFNIGGSVLEAIIEQHYKHKKDDMKKTE